MREPGRVSALEANQPTTSAMRCDDPAFRKASTVPSTPTRAWTRLGTVSPAAKLRFEAVGRASPVG